MQDLTTYRCRPEIKAIRKKLHDNTIELFVEGHEFMDSYTIQVSKYLVTNSMFCEFLNVFPYNYVEGDSYYIFNCINTNNAIQYDVKSQQYFVKAGLEKNPVAGVNWYGALLFAFLCDGRLITEYEYEKTVLGISRENANFGNKYGFTTPVDYFAPNELGIYDSIGNLRVWCMDLYIPQSRYFCNKKDLKGESRYRVVKGNAWDKSSIHFDTSIHEGKWPRVGTMGIGVRVVFSDYEINFV